MCTGMQVDFWNAQKNSSAAASAIADALYPLKKSLNTLATPTTTFPAASDEAEVVYSTLLAAWDANVAPSAPPAYPGRRMRHLLHLLCGNIITFVRSKLAAVQPRSVMEGSLWGLRSLSDITAAENDVGMATELLQTWRDHHLAQLMRDWMPGPACIARYELTSSGTQRTMISHMHSCGTQPALCVCGGLDKRIWRRSYTLSLIHI